MTLTAKQHQSLVKVQLRFQLRAIMYQSIATLGVRDAKRISDDCFERSERSALKAEIFQLIVDMGEKEAEKFVNGCFNALLDDQAAQIINGEDDSVTS